MLAIKIGFDMNILLLRGMMRQCEHWGEFPHQLQELKNVDRVLCLDLPGVGTESGRVFLPVMSQVVQDIRSRFLLHEKNHSHEPWAILGHSLGGMIAMQWAHDFPHDFEKIIVVNSSSRDASLLKRLKIFSAKKMLEIFLEKDIAEREKHILEMISNFKKNDAATIERWIKIAKEFPAHRHVAAAQLTAAAVFKSPKNINPPMLVLTSRADRMVDYTCSKFLAHKYHAHIHIHPTSGHDIALDDPAWLIEKIGSWIS